MIGLWSGIVDGNGARYRELNDGSLWAIEEKESPCCCRVFKGVSSVDFK